MVKQSKPTLKVTVDQSPFNMVDITDNLIEIMDHSDNFTDVKDFDTKLTENSNRIDILVININLTENSNQTDTLSLWFQQGFYHILEKIFLALSPEEKVACARVSTSWREIVEYFYESTNPRYKVLQNHF